VSIFKGLMKTPGKCPIENIQDSEHGENLKSRIELKFTLAVYIYVFIYLL
jgi:hypothetical protein